ncbi:hypothetical protein OEZ85_002484 [Tetradesmus obliquus]|uniref:Photosystem II Psb27 protein n=1 Tax=Tetradesmus obliquus TaxID=3088 RepID=A0ABY8TZX2_TETOB|nr:hypothetical protein OEZ85_002484 [Tetradesmus obliquus]
MSLLLRSQAGCGVVRPAATTSRRSVTCSAALNRTQQDNEVLCSRREGLLQASIVATLFVAGPAAAVCADLDTAEAGDACREAQLAQDKLQDYGAVTAGKTIKADRGLNTEYSQATRSLADKIEQYLSLDVYDKQRQPLIKSLKVDGSTWVSKYARGGSAKTQSARNMYIAVDAVQGYMASNGLAPFPGSKAKLVRETLSKSLAFLDEGR